LESVGAVTELVPVDSPMGSSSDSGISTQV
jgi:hypothetical protein